MFIYKTVHNKVGYLFNQSYVLDVSGRDYLTVSGRRMYRRKEVSTRNCDGGRSKDRQYAHSNVVAICYKMDRSPPIWTHVPEQLGEHW